MDGLRYHRGMLGYATILRALMDEPCTAHRLMDRIDLRHSASKILQGMQKRGLVHITGWVPNAKAGRKSAIWSAWDGFSVPYPGVAPHLSTFTGGVELLTFKHIIDALRSPCSQQDLASITGASRGTVRRLIQHMRGLRLIHIGDWDRTNPRFRVAMWRLGDRPQAKRPRALTESEICIRYRASVKRRETAHQMHHMVTGWVRQPEAAAA